MATFEVHALPTFGRTLVPDSDHIIGFTEQPIPLLLINVPPGEYAYESHGGIERIVCLSGVLRMESEDGSRAAATAGEMIEVPTGLRHRFAADCDAVILTLPA
eukprot:c22610_g1_i1.p3 GENE.c22610_g1_i1~~c22610_g1_i1.p3  ORF type:complete len:103 (-),score=10.74 c22610_g1_i1:228-536(-)